MDFRISPLSEHDFSHLFGLSDGELRTYDAVRMTANARPGFPCRLTLQDAEIGESVLLVNYEHLPVASPYRSSHAVFVRENAASAAPAIGEVPESLRIRQLSVRAFDEEGMMQHADVTPGEDLETVIARFFDDPRVAYLHVHNAKQGCYAARVDRC